MIVLPATDEAAFFEIANPENPMTKTFDLYFHCFQQIHRIPSCFCQTPCNHRIVEEEKRLLAGPGKRCGPEQSG